MPAALPAPPLPPARAGLPAVLPLDPPAGSGIRGADLVALAADAAAGAPSWPRAAPRWTPSTVSPACRNRLTRGPVQLRLGQDGLWYGQTRSGTG
jgi:hypothetical protein